MSRLDKGCVGGVGERWGGYKEFSGFAFSMGEVGDGEYAMTAEASYAERPYAANLVSYTE